MCLACKCICTVLGSSASHAEEVDQPLHKQWRHSLVGVGVVVVVLEAPWLEGVDEGSEHYGAHDVLHQLVLVEAPVAAVMANDEPLRASRVRERGEEVRTGKGWTWKDLSSCRMHVAVRTYIIDDAISCSWLVCTLLAHTTGCCWCTVVCQTAAASSHPGEGGAGEGPGEGQQVPRGDGNEVQAGREGADAGQHGAPGLAVVHLEYLGGVVGREG